MHREQKQTYMQHIQDNTAQHRTQHTICTQFAHTEQNNMQHIHINTEQDNTEQNTDTETNNPAQPQRTFMHTYSFDYYNEYVAIKNSDTIEIYTISKENI